jgi:hypothetical protein
MLSTTSTGSYSISAASELAPTLPLTLEFRDLFDAYVLAVRIDVDTVDAPRMRNGAASTDSPGLRGKGQVYLRRSSLYVQILPAPSVELLATSRFRLGIDALQLPLPSNTGVDTADFVVLKVSLPCLLLVPLTCCILRPID